MTKSLIASVAILNTMLFIRGVDYVTGNAYDAQGKVFGESLSMPGVWGASCLIISVLVFFALAFRHAQLTKNLCFFGFGINSMFALQIYERRMLPFPWPPEDSRLIVDHLGHALLWLLFAAVIWWREGVKRRRSELLEGGEV